VLAGLSVGVPIITLPIKIHLESVPGSAVDLGSSCFIRADMDPIVLQPENTDLSNVMPFGQGFIPDGSPNPNGPLFTIAVPGAVQGDNTFSVPGASGCGPNGAGSLNGAVNAIVGLPSPSARTTSCGTTPPRPRRPRTFRSPARSSLTTGTSRSGHDPHRNVVARITPGGGSASTRHLRSPGSWTPMRRR
jgi:hypothetical protein